MSRGCFTWFSRSSRFATGHLCPAVAARPGNRRPCPALRTIPATSSLRTKSPDAGGPDGTTVPPPCRHPVHPALSGLPDRGGNATGYTAAGTCDLIRGRVVIDARRHATHPRVMAGGGRPPTTLSRATKEIRGWPPFASHDTERACHVVRTSVFSRLSITGHLRASTGSARLPCPLAARVLARHHPSSHHPFTRHKAAHQCHCRFILASSRRASS